MITDTMGERTPDNRVKLEPQLVFEPLRHWSVKTPEKVAIVSSSQTLTYRELDCRTSQIAKVLASLGVVPEDRVGFVLPRGVETVLLMIGILKAGAAYVPLDAESPLTRIKDCLDDADPRIVVTDEMRSFSDQEEGIKTVLLSSVLHQASQVEVESNDSSPDLDPSSLAYMIFTSGTTGRPKGVPITHEALTNFVVGDQDVCIRVEPEDVVLHGFSPASDGHHEELWPTFLAGATLAVATSSEVHSGQDLANFLNSHKVTIVSCAPTLLGMVDEDVPTLRRILFGAESCPPAAVKKWWTPTREVLNTYGPTEATVGATFSVLHPDRPITIGSALPNYFCYVLDEELNEVNDGAEGELCIAGVSVSKGYFRREDLTVEKFLVNPFADPALQNEILYRTGDRVKKDETGQLVWLGRVDNQTKIRGHRIELSEIESVLLEESSLESAVVIARELPEDDKQLVALLVVRQGQELPVGSLLGLLRDKLPGYMVPQVLEEVERIPRLPSGKIDRRACQLMNGQVFRIEREIVPPLTENEKLVHRLWQEVFPHHEVSCNDDFFRDLGGYSLIASRFISVLRNDTPFTRVSVLDLYENPTVRSFATILDDQVRPHQQVRPFKEVRPGRYAKAKFFQALGVLFIFGLQGLFWLGPVLAAIYFSTEMGHSDAIALLLGIGLHAISVPILLLLSIAAKWLVGGRFEPGDYPLWGTTYLRWWFVQRMLGLAPVTFITGTPLASVYLRLLGAKIGKNVTLESLEFDCPDLVTIGDDCVFENSSWLHCADVSHGELHLRTIKIGDGCNLGVRAGLSGGAAMETGASLRDLTAVSNGVTVPMHEEWEGSLARKAQVETLPKYDKTKQPSAKRTALFACVQYALVVVLTFLDSLPFMIVAFSLYNWSEGIREYIWEPVYAIAMVAIAAVQVLLVKWGVLGKLKPGTYRYPSGLWIRKWFSDKHLELASGALVPIYDSLFARPWCILLGMKCGPRCEIALPRRMPYDLVEMGEESFLASEVSIGRPVRRNSALMLERTTVGKRSFLGNDSVVPQGVRVPDEFLLGVLSVCPKNEDIGHLAEEAWLGSPPFQMPSRQIMAQFDSKRTYEPTAKLYAQRLLHETVRVFLPGLCSLVIASILIEGFVAVWDAFSLGAAIAAIPLFYLTGVLAGALMCKLSKAVLIGKYRPTIQPLWSQFVWKTETHSAVLHDFAAPLFLTDLLGTPFLSGFMRFMGAKVGKRAFINSTDWTETDLIQIGADVAINANAPLQAHLFEDRVMKVGPIKIGDRCAVGNYSVVLCESELKNDCQVADLSLVMKGETIPSNSYWAGSPAQSVDYDFQTLDR